jgi:protein-disulfide isomerase
MENSALPFSIVVAALVLSVGMLFASNNVGNSLDKLSASIEKIKIQQVQAPAVTATPRPTATEVPTPTPAVIKMADQIKDSPGMTGSKDAKVVIVEYSDYQCPFCRRHYAQVETQIMENYVKTGKVAYYWKDFPLVQLHPMATASAQAVRCAGEQGKYWEMHDKVFDEEHKLKPDGSTASYTNDDLKKWASQITGIDATKFNACVDADKFKTEINNNEQQGIAIGIQGTPSFAIGKVDGTGTLISGAYPYETFQQAIENALKP